MNITYTAQIKIHSDIESTWQAVIDNSFVKDFLPEVKRNEVGISEYIKATHQNAGKILPSYTIPGKAVCWDAGAGVFIRLPRKDMQANIESIDVGLEDRGAYTIVIVNVNYQHKVDRAMLTASKCIRGLFKIKLNVLKKELEADNKQTRWASVIASSFFSRGLIHSQ